MSEEFALTIGQRLRRCRLQSGHTQESTARALQVPALVISRLERGKLLPTPWLLVELCQLFGVSADTLLGLSTAHH
jgi:transcriptional regulator with XRE-family HTH domain